MICEITKYLVAIFCEMDTGIQLLIILCRIFLFLFPQAGFDCGMMINIIFTTCQQLGVITVNCLCVIYLAGLQQFILSLKIYMIMVE